eukprot:SAG11_NODE_6786_length_1249_cov_1.055652_2_plen_55_part_00
MRCSSRGPQTDDVTAFCAPPPGEICVSNDEMISGYFKAPEMTAEKFFEADGKRW